MQLLAKAQFARDRAASASQQAQHLSSLGLSAQAATAARTQASQQQLLTVRSACCTMQPARAVLQGSFKDGFQNIQRKLRRCPAKLVHHLCIA